MTAFKRILISCLVTLLFAGSILPAQTVFAAAVPADTLDTSAGITEPDDSIPASAYTAAASADAAVAPGKVQLVSVSSNAYNKITVSWKKVSGATSYRIYYRASNVSKWSRIDVVGASQLQYTHVSSKSFPISVGKDYCYTVRAYNSRSRLLGDYNRKGLMTHTIPNKVTLRSAVWNTNLTAVTVTWKKAGGAEYYRIYRRTPSDTKWSSIGVVFSDKVQFVDRNPIRGEKNSYTVRACHLNPRVPGKFSGTQVTAVSRTQSADEQTARLLSNSSTAAKTGQIILVVDHSLSFWEKDQSGNWVKKLSVYCGYGSNGLNDDRHEGDRTTPIGSFRILHGFGTADNPGSSMQYRKITRNSYWSGEYNTYNQWVESIRPVAGEHLIDYYQYKYAMAIGFNRNPTVYKKGSAIFLHCKSYDHWSTAGCVSVEESVMKKLLQMSRNGVYMIIVREQNDIASY